MDVFSEMLKKLQIQGSLLLNEAYMPPWSIAIPDKSALSDILKTTKNTHIAAFHLVLRGGVDIELQTGHHENLRAGEMVICFSGDAHVLYQGDKQQPRTFVDIVQSGNNTFQPEDPDAKDATLLICGIFLLQDTFLNPLFDALPAVLKLAAMSDCKRTNGADNIVNLLTEEVRQPVQASDYMVARYLELLCATAIRLYKDNTAASLQSGWLKALQDPMVTQVLIHIHAKPSDAWSVSRLAQLVALSPSRFAARFTHTMGITPMLYITRWRMYLASKMLKDTRWGIAQISSQVGYEDVTAFSRAFKRYVGSAPGFWRSLQHIA